MLRHLILLTLAAVLVARESGKTGVDECAFCPEGVGCVLSGCTKSCSATSLKVNRKEWFLGGEASVGSSADAGSLKLQISARKGRLLGGEASMGSSEAGELDGLMRYAGRGGGTIIVNADLVITCRVANSGKKDQLGVEVALVARRWGLSFNTGPLGVCLNGTCAARSPSGTGIIGIATVDIRAGEEALVEFSHTFDNTAFTGLEVRVNGGVIDSGMVVEGGGDGMAGGEGSDSGMLLEAVDSSSNLISSFGSGSLTDVGCVDRATLNLDVLHTVENASYRLPMINDMDVPVVVRPVFRCRGANNTTFAPCTNVVVFMPSLADGTITIPARGESYAEIRAVSLEEERVEVAFFAQNVETGEVEQAVLEVVVSSVEALLNAPQLCCIASVRLRAMLESILVSVLVLYEQGEPYKAAMMVRHFIRKAKGVLCDTLPANDQGCIQKALITVLDAARMMAAEALGADQELAAATGATSIEPGKATALRAMQEGDDLRREGLYEEAVLKYARRHSRAHLSGSKTFLTMGAAGPGSPLTMLSADLSRYTRGPFLLASTDPEDSPGLHWQHGVFDMEDPTWRRR